MHNHDLVFAALVGALVTYHVAKDLRADLNDDRSFPMKVRLDNWCDTNPLATQLIGLILGYALIAVIG